MTRTYNFIFSPNKNFDPQVIRCLNVFLIYSYENNAIKKLDHENFIGIMLKVLNSRPIKCNLSCFHSSLMLNVDEIPQRNKHCYGEINIVTVI